MDLALGAPALFLAALHVLLLVDHGALTGDLLVLEDDLLNSLDSLGELDGLVKFSVEVLQVPWTEF